MEIYLHLFFKYFLNNASVISMIAIQPSLLYPFFALGMSGFNSFNCAILYQKNEDYM